MNSLQLELTKLIGSKELTFGCFVLTKDKDYDGKPVAIVIKSFDGIDTSYTGYSHTTDNLTVWITFGGKYNSGKIKPICSFHKNEMEIIGHPATLSDFHRWMNENCQESGYAFTQYSGEKEIVFYPKKSHKYITIPYNSSKDLLDQEEETLKQIIELIKNNK